MGAILAALILLFVLAGQFRLRPIQLRQLVLLPAIALVVGIFLLFWDEVSLSATQVTYMLLQLGVAVLAGSARGLAIRIVARGPIAMRVGGWALAAAWAGTIVARLTVDLLLRTVSSTDTAIVTSLPLFLGLTLAIQNVILLLRVKRAGLRWLTGDDRRQIRERRRRRQ